MLNVSAVLEQRYPRFFQRHALMARNLSRFLGLLFYQSRFEQLERDYPELTGFDFVEGALNYFDFSLRLRDKELARIPDSGPVIIAANHPIGSLDGLALLQLVRGVRSDVRVVANELLTAIKPLQPVLMPVHNMGGNTPRSNLKDIHSHLKADGALIFFPAGEVSRFGVKGVKDGVWQPGFVKLAQATRSPILPIFVAGRNSLFFYSLSALSKPLSTLWLVREMFHQQHSVVDARVGKAIPYESYSSFQASPRQLAALFRKHVYRLGRDARPVFQTQETVAHPENRLLLRRELAESELLGTTPNGLQMLLYRQQPGDCVLRELGRLRELTFRSVGEGTGKPRDIDAFDKDYFQLILWDSEGLEIAGAYRLGCAAELVKKRGPDGLYTHTLFEFSDAAMPLLEQGLEMGRSFVQPRYQDRNSLDYLWWGIGAFLKRYPHYRYLFGPVSISRYYGAEGISQLVYFYRRHYGANDLGIRARRPFEIPSPLRAQCANDYDSVDRQQGFRILRAGLKARGLAVPTLYKHYMDSAEPGGVSVAAFNVDPDFGDCVDGFVLLDLWQLKPAKQKRYLGEEGYFDGSAATGWQTRLPHTLDFRCAPGK